jgi:hypothetical protein
MTALAPYREKGCLTGGCPTCGICLATEQEEPMVTQTHTVATDALATIGNLIDESAGRDAIHLAVEPIVAGAALNPGQDVGIVDGKAFPRRPYLGIVDPFLSKAVKEGQRFWLVVYPRQITSLRHVWEHPSFPAAVEPVESVDAKAYSTKWMTDWAVRHMSADYYGDVEGGRYSPEEALGNAIEAGRHNHVGPYESARDAIDAEWWGHWEAITGETGNRDDYFSCSC